MSATILGLPLGDSRALLPGVVETHDALLRDAARRGASAYARELRSIALTVESALLGQQTDRRGEFRYGESKAFEGTVPVVGRGSVRVYQPTIGTPDLLLAGDPGGEVGVSGGSGNVFGDRFAHDSSPSGSGSTVGPVESLERTVGDSAGGAYPSSGAPPAPLN